MRLDPSATQFARDPEPVASRLVSHNYPRDRLASPDRLRLPAIHHTHDFVHVTRLHARLRTPRDAGNHRSQLPGLAAQFHRHHQRAIVIEGGRGAVRIEIFSHRIAPFHEVCNHRISNPAAAPIESCPGHLRGSASGQPETSRRLPTWMTGTSPVMTELRSLSYGADSKSLS